MRESPFSQGIPQSRWRLTDLAQSLDWLQGCSLAGVHQILDRLDFHRKLARTFIHSPDPEYAAKKQAMQAAVAAAQTRPEEVITLYLDELTFYRQPRPAPAYWTSGPGQPLALQTPGSNTKTRIVAVLELRSGRVIYRQRSKVGRAELIAFWGQIAAAFPEARQIYVIADNWPTHKLPDVLAAAAEHHLNLVFLPTYASWLNPIEKLWRWLRQSLLHLHNLPDDLATLRERTTAFLDRFAQGSPELLHYVGLLPN